MFDDNDPEDTCYMGLASVSLLPLAHNRAIQGCYQLETVSVFCTVKCRT